MWIWPLFPLLLLFARVFGQTPEEKYCKSPFLRPSEHSFVVLPKIGRLQCFYECRDNPINFYYDDQAEMRIFETMILVLSIIAFVITIALCCNLCVGHFRSKTPFYIRRSMQQQAQRDNECFCKKFVRGFKNRPFLYDIPWMLQIGYFLINKTLLIPFVVPPKYILCNESEQTMIDNMQMNNVNAWCLITALSDIMGVHIIGLYKTALSISLYQSVSDKEPIFYLSRSCLHSILWSLICIFSIIPIVLQFLSADWLFNVCSIGDKYPYFMIAPLSIYTLVTFIFLSLSIYNLHLHIKSTSGQQVLQRRKMKQFQIRLALFNIFVVGSFFCLILIVSLTYSWTQQREDALNQAIECRIEGQTLAECKEQYNEIETYQTKYVICHSFYPVCFLFLVMSGFILSLTDDNMKYWEVHFRRTTQIFRSRSNMNAEELNDLHPLVPISMQEEEKEEEKKEEKMIECEREKFTQKNAVYDVVDLD